MNLPTEEQIEEARAAFVGFKAAMQNEPDLLAFTEMFEKLLFGTAQMMRKGMFWEWLKEGEPTDGMLCLVQQVNGLAYLAVARNVKGALLFDVLPNPKQEGSALRVPASEIKRFAEVKL